MALPGLAEREAGTVAEQIPEPPTVESLEAQIILLREEARQSRADAAFWKGKFAAVDRQMSELQTENAKLRGMIPNG